MTYTRTSCRCPLGRTNDVTKAGALPLGAGVMNGSLSSAIHCPSPGRRGETTVFIGGGGQPILGVGKRRRKRRRLRQPELVLHFLRGAAVRKLRVPTIERVNATALTHCIRSSPNDGIARTRSTAQVTRLPGRARSSRSTRTNSLPDTTLPRVGSMTTVRSSASISTMPSSRQRNVALRATGSSAYVSWTTPSICPVCWRLVRAICVRCTRVKSPRASAARPPRSSTWRPV